MSGKWTYRVLTEIRRLRQELPRGWVTEVDEKAQHGQGYLSRVLSGKIKRLDVETLFCLLEHPLIDAREFLRRIGLHSAAPNPYYYLEQIKGPRNKDPILDDLLKLTESFDGVGASVDLLADLDRLAELEAIDELRFSDQAGALNEFSGLIRSGAPWGSRKWMLRALGLFASLRRAQGRFGASSKALRRAFQLSSGLQDCQADLMQRLTYLVANHGWWATAADFARQAREIYLFLDDRAGIGASLVDQAIMHGCLNQLDESAQCYTSALKYLPETSCRNRTTALHGLGWIELQRGQLTEAQNHLQAAMEIFPGKKAGNWAKIMWLKGEIHLRQREFLRAEEAFRSSASSFSFHDDPYDFALVSLQLAEVLLLCGRGAEVDQIANWMIRLLTPFQNNHLAGALILEFVQAAEQHRVTLKQLDRIRSEFRKMRGAPLEFPAQDR